MLLILFEKIIDLLLYREVVDFDINRGGDMLII